MAQPEARLSRNIKDAINERFGVHVFIFKVWGSDHMMAGLPDLIGCLGGHFFGLEVKTPGKRSNTSARQDYVHGLIKAAGGVVAVVESVREAVRLLEELDVT